MDVLGLYLLQRIPTELTIQRNQSFEKTYVSRIPDSPAAPYINDGYLSQSKDVVPAYYPNEL